MKNTILILTFNILYQISIVNLKYPQMSKNGCKING